MDNTAPYPEHDKLEHSESDREAIAYFLEWLQEKKLVIAEFVPEKWNGEARSIHPNGEGCNRLLCDRSGCVPNPNYEYIHQGYYPAHRSIETWLAEYFGIDMKKLEEENRAILAEIRSHNEEGA